MSTDCLAHVSRPRSPFSVRSWRAFTIILAITLSCLATCSVALGMPAEGASGSSLERPHEGPREILSNPSGDSAPASAAKTETPPSEEDPEVDEIDPFVGGLDRLLVHWFKGLANLLG